MESQKILEKTLTQRWKDVLRELVTLRLRDLATTIVLHCHNVPAMSLYNVVSMLSANVGETFISKELAILTQRIARSCDNFVISLCVCLVASSNSMNSMSYHHHRPNWSFFQLTQFWSNLNHRIWENNLLL